MKVTTITETIEGTPAEIRDYQNRGTNGDRLAEVDHDHPSHVQEWLESVRPGTARDTLESLLTEVQTWDDVYAVRGTGQGERYMRLYRRHTPAGALAYLHPTKAEFRVPADAASALRHARPRGVQSSNPHQVTLPLDSPEALDEALQLARRAYEGAVA